MADFSLAAALVALTRLRDTAQALECVRRTALHWTSARRVVARLAPEVAQSHDSSEASPEALGALMAAAMRSAQLEKQVENKAYFCAVPLRDEAEIIGVLGLEFDAKAQRPTDEEFAIFVTQAAAAIANARLFEQLQRAKREWQRTFDGMVDGVAIEDENGRIVRVNGAMAALLGVPMNEILGQKRNELLHRLKSFRVLRALAPATHIVPGLPVQNGEFCFGAPAKFVLQTVFPLDEPDENSSTNCVCVLRDITEPRHLQEQLLQSEKLAALGELVSGVAHELNNPLTAVLGYAQLLETDPELPEKLARSVQTIHGEAARASRIVGNLLAFARREEPRRLRLDINEVVRAVIEMRTYQLQAQNTRLVARLAENLPPVLGDAQQLQQVLLNIINNAHQATQEWRGGGEIVISTEALSGGAMANEAVAGDAISTDAPHGWVRIAVSDDGPGIAPEHLRRIFDPFWTTKPLGEGTGLGMSISLGLVSNHGGQLRVESTLGHGARFFMDLPAAPQSTPEFDADLTSEAEPRAAHSSGAGAQILVIDDEEPVVMLIEEVLALDGHEVTPAFNGAEALALLQDRSFDLILSDVRMPAVGGPTFFETLQTTRPDLLPRVVFVTGDTVSPSTREFLRRAGRPILAKPFAPERLRALVNANLTQE